MDVFFSYLTGLGACFGGAQLAMRFLNITKSDAIKSAP